METILNKVQTLVDRLNYYTKLYDEGNPEISDTAWDKMYFDLVQLETAYGIILPNSPTQKINYQVINQLNKIAHNHPMLSLDKTKDLQEIKQFIGNKQFILMHKLDGLTCSLTYDNGKLVKAETRGNGEVGEDILHNAFVVKNIPNAIPVKGHLVVDGEIICFKKDFEPFAEEYKNPRNFASGSIRLLDNKECEKRNLSFIAWDLIETDLVIDISTLSQKLGSLKELGFDVVDFTASFAVSLEETISSFKEQAIAQGIPIDGLVFKWDNCEEFAAAGRTSHHFRGGLAFKFEDETAETELIDIEWTMGRTGVLTPVAIYKTVELEGTECNRATLHNLSVLEDVLKVPYKNQKIVVYKSHQINPQIKEAETRENLEETEIFHFPTKCPVCGAPVEVKQEIESKTLHCTGTDCSGKLINRLDHFAGKKGLDIKGLSKATLEKLINWGWVNSCEDIFKLREHELDWKQQPGFGEKSVNNILSAIETGTNCTLNSFISALGIPLIGTNIAKELVKHFVDFPQFLKAVEDGYLFWELEGFGPEMHRAIVEFDYTEAKNLYNNYITIRENRATEANDNSLQGLIFVITGSLIHYKNRNELKSAIEEHGGKVSGSISGKTNYLVNNDINSTSSKNATAKKLGIPIISEEALIEMFNH